MRPPRCPTCGGKASKASQDVFAQCVCGRDFSSDDLHVAASTGAIGALWAAVHALEDKASSGRWRSRQPQPPPHLQDTIDRADEEAGAIRDVLKQRDGGSHAGAAPKPSPSRS